MKQRRMTMAALACGVLCAVCVAAFLWSVHGEAETARAEALERYGGEQVETCVATRDVAAGERLDASAVETKLWIADLLPEGAVFDAADVVGRTATSSILKGEVVVAKRFQEGQGAIDIPQGKQAVSVPAKTVQAVGGAIRPGMSVDVYSSGSSGTSLLAKDVIVLATSVGESGTLVSSDTGWITLAVSPERVEEIISASSKTSLYFALPDNAPDASGASASGESAQASGEGDQAGSTSEKSDGASGVAGSDGAASSGGAPSADGSTATQGTPDGSGAAASGEADQAEGGHPSASAASSRDGGE